MYPVSDVPRAAAFYRDVIGLEQDGAGADFWVEFAVGDATFGIGNFEQVGKPGTAQSLALEIPDLPAFREKVAAAGLETTEPFETSVCFISMIRDPDGNQIWLHQSKPDRPG
jgi:predicted enzyme related to lactoylglutathione lyase